MGGVSRYGSNSLAAFLDAPDPVYGTGVDGSVTFDGSSTVLGIAPSASTYQNATTVYTLTRDIFCYNMTVNDAVRISPNGYRIFVKNILTLGNGSIVGFNTGFAADGSIFGGVTATSSATHSLGGNGGGAGAGTATAPTSASGGTNYYKQPLQAIRGYSITSAGGANFLRGGAGGSTGVGGGIVICSARYISCTATTNDALFTAPGGVSGGGGGVILIVSSAGSLPTNITTIVAGDGTGTSGTVNYMQLV